MKVIATVEDHVTVISDDLQSLKLRPFGTVVILCNLIGTRRIQDVNGYRRLTNDEHLQIGDIPDDVTPEEDEAFQALSTAPVSSF